MELAQQCQIKLCQSLPSWKPQERHFLPSERKQFMRMLHRWRERKKYTGMMCFLKGRVWKHQIKSDHIVSDGVDVFSLKGLSVDEREERIEMQGVLWYIYDMVQSLGYICLYLERIHKNLYPKNWNWVTCASAVEIYTNSKHHSHRVCVNRYHYENLLTPTRAAQESIG